MRKGLLIFFILYFILFIKAQSQCCGAGNPISGFENVSGIPYKTLLISPTYKYSISDTYFTGNEKNSISPDKMNYNFTSISIAYGINPRLSIQGQIGYFINKTKKYNISDWKPMRGFGLGDAEINVMYAVIKNIFKDFSLITGVGIKLPIGVFDQEVNNVKLPISLQPSSGSLKFNASVFMNKKFNEFNVSFRGFAEIANRIKSQNFDYKYGNLYLMSFYGSYNINKKISFVAQIRYEYRGKSLRENEQIVESSGGQLISFIPEINIIPAKSFSISVYPDIPIYKYMNGTQITNKFAISLKLTKSFNLYRNNEYFENSKTVK
ncbi:MAG: hypothetical protein JEY97_10420 [Bacteroidales bacterium]|nr:hypothetical protein [Bacteroidales bacterium]